MYKDNTELLKAEEFIQTLNTIDTDIFIKVVNELYDINDMDITIPNYRNGYSQAIRDIVKLIASKYGVKSKPTKKILVSKIIELRKIIDEIL